MIYSILPTAVQTRLPRLPSLRRFAISLTGRETPAEVQTERSSGDSSMSTSGTTTPGIEYKDALALQLFTESLGLVLRQNNANGPVDDNSGIEWKYAHQGLNLLSLAVNESSTINSRSANASFARQLYLHALTYLLRGLPQDLSMEEQLSIRGALPADIVEPIQVQVNNSNTFNPTPLVEPSLLHRTLASSIVQLFVLFQFVLPYFTYFLAAAYHYDREHKILQRGFAQGMETFDRFGKSTFALGSVVLEMGDGKVGQVVGDLITWIVNGVAGGIQEGVGEVMLIVGTSKAQSLSTKS